MNRSLHWFLILLLFPTFLSAQSAILENYVNEGLKNNLALQQKEFSLQKSMYALKEARGLFLPSLNFLADYTYAGGGRSLDIPVGDLLNPVYTTLNQLTNSNSFPQVENATEEFLPNDYHTTRLEAAMPLINAEVFYNQQIKKEDINFQQAAVNVYKRELVKEIKNAYYKYLQSIQAAKIYANTSKLLGDNKAVTEALVKNNVALPGNVLKINADLEKFNALYSEALNNRELAAAYFNFLQNKPFNMAIEEDSLMLNEITIAQINYAASVENREEILQLKSGIEQNNILLKLHRSHAIPQLSTFFDVGYQGYYYTFDKSQQYYFGGLQLKWNLFSGFTNTNKVRQTETDVRSLNLQLDETEKQLKLELTRARLELQSAIAKQQASQKALEYARDYYRITQLRYGQNLALLIELTDALNQLTGAQLSLSLSNADVLIKQADVERAAAIYKL
ncbi:MAG: TolC family protein [Chitinophagaceae bacterium]|nr:TolC family protein [Chitinophagaceae bacterium]